MTLALLLLLSLCAFGQTALIPATSVCPAPQITVAQPTGALGSYAVVNLLCLSYDATVVLTSTATPWTITSLGASVAATQGLSRVMILASIAPPAPGACSAPGAVSVDSSQYLYLCLGQPLSSVGIWIRSAAPMVSSW